MEKVWPPLEGQNHYYRTREEDFQVELPSLRVQERLVDLYFIHVHPNLPILNKQTFLSEFLKR
jgi:hypothetical protein